MKNKLAYVEGWLSIALNVILFLLKYYAGVVTGSIAIIADAWHTLSDSLTSGIVILGAKFSQKKSDQKHPFGYGRIELVASIIIGVLLSIAGVNFIMESIEKLQNHQTYQFKMIVVFVFAASVLIKEAIAQFSFWASKKTDSRALRSDGWHHRSDALASLLVLAGVFLGKFFWWIDGVLGIVIGILIIVTGIKIIKDDVEPLLGEAPSEKQIEEINSLILKLTGEEFQTHHFHIHRYGSHTELTFHINLKNEMTILEGHQKIDSMEKGILKETGIEATIHMEPQTDGTGCINQSGFTV